MKPKQRNDRDTVRRMRPKKGFAKFLRGKVKTFNAHINEFEDDTASSTVVRWLVVVLLLHLIFIGGASLHGFLVKNRNNATAEIPAASQSTAPAPAPAVPQQPAGQPVTQVQAITAQAGGMAEAPIPRPQEDIPAAVPVEPEPVAQATQIAQPGSARHLVATGDTWDSIARDNSCSVADLKAVNPGAKLTSGTNLIIPMSAEEMANAATAEEVTGEESTERVYVMKKGDTLSKIAREYKVSVNALQKHNNITDPRKVKIGQEIRIPGN